MGVWTYNIVAVVVVYELSGSAFTTGLVTVAQSAPQLFLTLLSGKLADRGDPGRQAVIGRLVCAGGSLGLALWILLAPEGNRSVVPYLVASLVVGLGFVLGGPALQSIVPRLVSHEELPSAVALNTLPMLMARAAGPAAGAAIATQADPAVAFGFAALAHLCFAILLVVARLPKALPVRGDVDFSVRAALTYVWRDKPMLILLTSIAVVGFVGEPSISLVPALAAHFGEQASHAGSFAAAFGVGGAAGFVLQSLLRRSPRFPLELCTVIGLAVLVVASALLAALIGPVSIIAAMVILGIGFTLTTNSASTLIQERSPAEIRGRVMAVWLVGFIGVRPISAAVLGVCADHVGLWLAFVVSATISLLCCVACLRALVRRPSEGPAKPFDTEIPA